MAEQASQVFSSAEELQTYIGTPMELAVRKAIPRLDRHCRAFIARSPFLSIGTAAVDGRADVSPRGDAPGFVQVLDDNTLFIPDRPGNNRLDTMLNIIENPHVGLLFMVPGFEDLLRVNGRAQIVRDEDLLDHATVKGKTPKVGIRVHVDEAYLHCAKAVKRSRLWHEESRQDRSALPSLGKIILEQTSATPPSAAVIGQVDELIEENYRTGLY